MLNYYQANALNLLGKCDEAGVKYKDVLASKKDWELPLVNWLNCLIKDEKYGDAIALINTYQDTFSLSVTYVKYLFSEQPGFIHSTEFKTWEDNQTAYP